VRLYREFRARPPTDTVIRDAIDAMVNQRASDPDYRSLWPATAQIHRASKSGAVATIDMETGPSAPAASAIQQLVWTVTVADRVRVLGQGRHRTIRRYEVHHRPLAPTLHTPPPPPVIQGSAPTETGT